MNIAEAFTEGKVACEVDGCIQVAKTAVKDLGHVFGQGRFAVDLIPVGPTHFFCNHHTRDSYSLEKVNGRWVRF